MKATTGFGKSPPGGEEKATTSEMFVPFGEANIGMALGSSASAEGGHSKSIPAATPPSGRGNSLMSPPKRTDPVTNVKRGRYFCRVCISILINIFFEKFKKAQQCC